MVWQGPQGKTIQNFFGKQGQGKAKSCGQVSGCHERENLSKRSNKAMGQVGQAWQNHAKCQDRVKQVKGGKGQAFGREK